MSGKRNKQKGQRTQSKERRAQIMELRKAGATYEEIAQAIGVSITTVHRQVQVALKDWRERTEQNTDDIVAIELRRLDRMLVGLWPRAKQGDDSAVDRVLKIQERRAKYLGLDAPSKIAPTDPTGDRPYEPLTNSERVSRLAAVLERARDRRDRFAALSAAEGGTDSG